MRRTFASALLFYQGSFNFRMGILVLLLAAGLQLDFATGRQHGMTKMSHYRDINDDPQVNIDHENTRPILGVLTQEVSNFIRRKYPDRQFHSYIAASYVKFVEGAGGRVVPIWIGRSRDYYEDILSKINGVLLPGGATFFNQSHGYADAGRHIYEIAMDMNGRGIYMPIWGTCLGFELLLYLSGNGTDARIYCESSSQALPLKFTKDYQKSHLFGNASNDIIETFQLYPVTANFHMYCITQETFVRAGLDQSWKILSLNEDWNGLQFISSVEHIQYPFYGVQFHPEKNLYEFVKNRNITHTSKSIKTSQYFADFLVNQARKNTQAFGNSTEETNSLIYNYSPEYTGKIGSAFVQLYLFEKHSDASNVIQNIGLCCLTLCGLVAMQRFYF